MQLGVCLQALYHLPFRVQLTYRTHGAYGPACAGVRLKGSA